MSGLKSSFYQSPIGAIEIVHNADFIVSLAFVDSEEKETQKPGTLLKQCLYQLDEYFAGTRKQFELPLAPTGTDFQKRVWRTLQGIAYAGKCSYLDIAKLMNDPKATRAIGAANGKNPIAIIIPCHRVVGSDNSLTGYAWGMGRKKWLLDHEAKFGLGIQQLF